MPRKKEASSESIQELTKETKKGGNALKIAIFLGALIIVILSVGGVLYFGLLNNKKPQANSDQSLLTAVGKLVVLPSGEPPAIATVSDIKKLSGQAFFVNALNGDKVLIYQSTGKAIIYRPSLDKIINIATINVSTPTPASSNSSQSAAQDTPTPTASQMKITILNGTKKSGLAKTAATALKAGGIDSEVATANAQNDYKTTEIVDLTGKNSQAVKSIIKILGGKTAGAPEDETKPTGDVLIILGQDYIK